MIGRRRTLSGLATAALAGAPSWARAAGPRARPRVVFINPGRTGEIFWEQVSAAMRVAAAQLGFALEIRMAERERARLRNLALAAAEESPAPDALVLVNEEQAAVPGLIAAGRRNIPVLLALTSLYGEELRHGPPRLRIPSFIGSIEPDNRRAGERMAETLIAAARERGWRAADGRIHLFAVTGEIANPAAALRSQGLREAVAAAEDVVLDRHIVTSWDAGEVPLLTRRYLDWALRAAIRPAGVWAANDTMALAAMGAFQESGLIAGVEAGFVGLNWAPAALAEGRLLLSEGGHVLGGAWALVLLRDWFDGHDFTEGGDAELGFRFVGLSPQNLGRFRRALGNLDWARVDFRRFTRGLRGRGAAYDFSFDALLAAAGGEG